MTALLKRHALAISGAILLLILCVQTLMRSQSEWQYVYVAAARYWIAAADMYRAQPDYAYPPFMAMVAAPLAAAPQWVSRLAWFAASAIGFVVMVAAAWRLAGGRSLRQMEQWQGRQDLYALACGLAIALGFIINAFNHQQTDVIIGGLLLAGALSLSKRRDALGGTLIGLAAACKASPLLWSPYLIWRRRWIAGGLVALIAIAVNLLPDLFVQSPRGVWWLEDWIRSYLLTTQQLDVMPGLWATALEYNQSLIGTAQRWVNTTLVFAPQQAPSLAERTLVSAAVLKICVYGAFVVLIVVSMAAANRARNHARPADNLPQRDSLEFSIVLILTLLFSPLSGRPHFGTLILPAFCLARFALATGDRIIMVMLGIVVILVTPPYRSLVSPEIHSSLLWVGGTTIATLLLWLGCVRALWRDQR